MQPDVPGIRRANPAVDELALLLFVLPGTRPEEKALGAQPAHHVCQEPQAGLIGPVDVIEHDGHRMLRADLTQEAGEGIELPEARVRRCVGRQPFRGLRNDIGSEALEVSSRSLVCSDGADVDTSRQLSDDLPPGPVWRHPGRVVRAPPQAEKAVVCRPCHRLLSEPGLPDSRLPLTQDDAGVHGRGGDDALLDEGELRGPPDELGPAHHQVVAPAATSWCRRRTTAVMSIWLCCIANFGQAGGWAGNDGGPPPPPVLDVPGPEV